MSYRENKRIDPHPMDRGPSRRIRRLLGLLGLLMLFSAGFIAGYFAREAFNDNATVLLIGAGGMLIGASVLFSHKEYGSAKSWWIAYTTLQRYSKTCYICGAKPGEDCNAAKHRNSTI